MKFLKILLCLALFFGLTLPVFQIGSMTFFSNIGYCAEGEGFPYTIKDDVGGEGVNLGHISDPENGNMNINPTYHTSISSLTFSFIKFLTGTVLLITILTFMIGAGYWIFSAGNESLVERGKDMMIYSIVGILLVLGAYAIIKLVQIILYALGT